MESGNTSVTEAGSTDTFTVVLGTQPINNVIFSLSSSDTGEATVSPSTLTFTEKNWSSPKTLTITGVDDTFNDGDITSTARISINTVSTLDSTYGALSSKTVSVTTIDNDDAPTVTLSSSSSSVTEGNSGTKDVIITASLSAAASANTDITLTTSGTATSGNDYTISSNKITIQAGNTSGTATLKINGDSTDEAVEKVGVSINSVSGGNGAKAGGNQIEVAINDDDTAGFSVVESGNTSVTEAGSTDTFTVVLGTQPINNVIFSLSSSDTGEATVSPSTLTFTEKN